MNENEYTQHREAVNQKREETLKLAAEEARQRFEAEQQRQRDQQQEEQRQSNQNSGT